MIECPYCGESFNGDTVPVHFIDEFGTPDKPWPCFGSDAAPAGEKLASL